MVDRAVGCGVRFETPDNDYGAYVAPRNTIMYDLITAAARRAVPAACGHTFQSRNRPFLPGASRFGVLSRDELRRAVAEVIG
ncbi:hypothetical protein B0I00_3370 [Novosphingobium kunmingense]|uniref:Uncharacterized protein n=2 Tax=Novosphingobium kunmingense TaxID=1211806 RepID=A0A2N0H311_9SPHN|nr:hypothetical protein B0I00_3370 [Novosphingobium kunmingense]